jgi:hypothetical protein
MPKIKKLILWIFLIFFITIPIAAFAHFIFFPQQTRSILIDYSGFKKNGPLYFNTNTPKYKIDTVQSLIQAASARVAGFWGQKTCNPKFIYCETEADFKKFGSPMPVPALTHIKFDAYIVISNEGAEADIIAHEISHVELYNRIGFYNYTIKIPTWFDEGLAMQNDYRNYYSEDTLKLRTGNFKNLPDVKQLKNGKQFHEGSNEQIKLNYMSAKHEVKNWYSKEKIQRLIKDLNAGKSFEDAFSK